MLMTLCKGMNTQAPSTEGICIFAVSEIKMCSGDNHLLSATLCDVLRLPLIQYYRSGENIEYLSYKINFFCFQDFQDSKHSITFFSWTFSEILSKPDNIKSFSQISLSIHISAEHGGGRPLVDLNHKKSKEETNK